jgi:hypothetical protein
MAESIAAIVCQNAAEDWGQRDLDEVLLWILNLAALQQKLLQQQILQLLQQLSQ